MRARAVTVLVVAAVVISACGGGSGDSSNTTAAPAPTTVAPAATTSDTADALATAPPTSGPAPTSPDGTTPDTTTPATTTPVTAVSATTAARALTPEAELAATALLTLADFDAGWTETPFDPVEDEADDAADDAVVAFIGECVGVDPMLVGDGVLGDRKAKSGTFTSPDEKATVKHMIGFAVDEPTALEAIAAIGDPALADCYEQALTARFENAQTDPDPANTLPEGLTLNEVTLERVDFPGGLGADEAVWYAAHISADFQGLPIDQYAELIFLRDGQVLTQLELGGDGAAFPSDMVDPIVQLALERAASIA